VSTDSSPTLRHLLHSPRLRVGGAGGDRLGRAASGPASSSLELHAERRPVGVAAEAGWSGGPNERDDSAPPSWSGPRALGHLRAREPSLL